MPESGMPPRWRETFLAWSREVGHATKVEDAEHRIRTALASCDKPYLAYSGGKDSVAMLHLVLQQAPHITVSHADGGPDLVPRPLYRELLANAERIGATDIVVRPGGPIIPALTWWQERGYDLCFVGLRSEESVARKLRIKARREILGRECWPLQDWSHLDVWAYIVARNLPHLAIYHERARLEGYERARWNTLFEAKFHHYGNESVDGVIGWRYRNRTR